MFMPRPMTTHSVAVNPPEASISMPQIFFHGGRAGLLARRARADTRLGSAGLAITSFGGLTIVSRPEISAAAAAAAEATPRLSSPRRLGETRGRAMIERYKPPRGEAQRRASRP